MIFVDKIVKKLAGLDDQEAALKSSWYAYLFARHIPGADIEKCQEVACRDSYYAFRFAKHIKEANIEKCQEAACKSPSWAYYFVCDIPGANIEKCIEVCKGTIWEDKLNQYLMNKALE